jgi:hypothetical protein
MPKHRIPELVDCVVGETVETHSMHGAYIPFPLETESAIFIAVIIPHASSRRDFDPDLWKIGASTKEVLYRMRGERLPIDVRGEEE